MEKEPISVLGVLLLHMRNKSLSNNDD